MSKLALTAAGVVLAGATALATMPANAFWGSWGGGGPWYGGPWHGGPWYGGYPYGGYGGYGYGYPYGGWGGYGHPYGGWGGYPYGGYGYGYPYAVAPVAPVAVQPATSSAAK